MIVLKQIGLLLCAVLLTVIVSLSTVPLRYSTVPMVNYVFSVLNERGPTPYMALFMMMYVVLASISCSLTSKRGLRRLTAISLILLSFGPLCIGYIGYAQGMGTMNLGIERLSTDPRTLQELRSFVGQIAVGRTVACDPLVLGLFGTFISLTASLAVWRQSALEGRIPLPTVQ